MAATKPFFNTKQDLYHGDEPAYYSLEKAAWISLLEANSPAIREELYSVLADSAKAQAAYQKFSARKTAGWKQMELKIYGISYPAKTALFPQTMSVLGQIPGISTIYFSLLEPGATVPPHVGDTDAFYRVHLGIEIPGHLPECGLQVAGNQRSWETDKCIVFNDVYHHTAWNLTNQRRIVLILDVLRPEFSDKALYTNSGVRATLFYSRLYSKTFFLQELLPRFIQRTIHPCLHAIFYVLHRIRFGKR